MAMKSRSAKPVECTQLDLRGCRLKKGMSLEQIANTTKISIGFLRAIEAEDFAKLPGGIFNTSYLKQYANAVGYEPETLLKFYERQTEPVRNEEVHVGSPTRGILRWLRVTTAIGR